MALEACLQQRVLDLLPVAELAGVRLSVQRSDSCGVLFEPRRLNQALGCLLEFVLVSVAKEGTVKIEIVERNDEAGRVLTILWQDELHEKGGVAQTASSARIPNLERPGLAHRLRLAIARTILEAGEGHLDVYQGEQVLRLEARLPKTFLPGELSRVAGSR